MPELVLYLLTHSRELQKSTNTGALVQHALVNSASCTVKVIEWQRKAPHPELVQLAAQQQLGLVYPLPVESLLSDLPPCFELQQGQYQAQNKAAIAYLRLLQSSPVTHWVLLDATWQEAAKMLRQSLYLQSCYRLGIKPDTRSVYCLRRNQKVGALCTAEVVIELLQQRGYQHEKEQLMLLFSEFNKR